ncbi:hypothetical protein O6H91_Y017800 [Diphasiastrum complanatum]|nr:hypothetical protein O6H91_Y017800 [Diphasiastrum complanatum]
MRGKPWRSNNLMWWAERDGTCHGSRLEKLRPRTTFEFSHSSIRAFCNRTTRAKPIFQMSQLLFELWSTYFGANNMFMALLLKRMCIIRGSTNTVKRDATGLRRELIMLQRNSKFGRPHKKKEDNFSNADYEGASSRCLLISIKLQTYGKARTFFPVTEGLKACALHHHQNLAQQYI